MGDLSKPGSPWRHQSQLCLQPACAHSPRPARVLAVSVQCGPRDTLVSHPHFWVHPCPAVPPWRDWAGIRTCRVELPREDAPRHDSWSMLSALSGNEWSWLFFVISSSVTALALCPLLLLPRLVFSSVHRGAITHPGAAVEECGQGTQGVGDAAPLCPEALLSSFGGTTMNSGEQPPSPPPRPAPQAWGIGGRGPRAAEVHSCRTGPQSPETWSDRLPPGPGALPTGAPGTMREPQVGAAQALCLTSFPPARSPPGGQQEAGAVPPGTLPLPAGQRCHSVPMKQ